MQLKYVVYPEPQRRHWLRRDTHPILKGVIGQNDAVETLTDLAFTSLGREDRCLPISLCLIGGPSTGKTFLAKVLAQVLGIVYVETDASQIKNNDKLIDQVLEAWARRGWVLEPDQVYDTTSVYRIQPSVVFIDEIHGLTRGAQDGLLKATDRADAMLFGRNRILDCNRITWIGATTDWGKLCSAFQSRFRPIHLYPFTSAEVALMLHRIKGWDDGLCRAVVHYAGNVPREVKQFAELLEAASSRSGFAMATMLPEVARREGIDQWGMRRQRLAVLQALKDQDGLLLRHLSGKSGVPQEELLKLWLPSMLAAPPGHQPLLDFDGRYHLTAQGRAELVKRGL